MKKSVKVLTALLTAVSLFACKSGKVPEKKASFKPGTYSGQAQGFHGLIKLNVTVDERSIKKIVITEQNETEGIGSNALAVCDTSPQVNGRSFLKVSGRTTDLAEQRDRKSVV